EVLSEALHQAREARLHILGEMTKTLSAPREDLRRMRPALSVSLSTKSSSVRSSGQAVKLSKKCNAKPVLLFRSMKLTEKVQCRYLTMIKLRSMQQLDVYVKL